MEAQACYSLGNTYTLLQDYERAIDYHLKHLVIAQDLNDRYWPCRIFHLSVFESGQLLGEVPETAKTFFKKGGGGMCGFSHGVTTPVPTPAPTCLQGVANIKLSFFFFFQQYAVLCRLKQQLTSLKN